MPNWGAKGRAPFAETFPPGTILWDRARTLRSRCAEVPDPAWFDWHLAPWPSFVYVEESGGIVSRKRPLDRRRAITGTPAPSGQPANPKTGNDPGRRRIFWWRDSGDMPLSQSSGRKARSIDPANVFGAADADADLIRKLAVAADGFDSTGRSRHTKKKIKNSSRFRGAPLDKGGHKCVRQVRITGASGTSALRHLRAPHELRALLVADARHRSQCPRWRPPSRRSCPRRRDT
jgi:hypothetical protein